MEVAPVTTVLGSFEMTKSRQIILWKTSAKAAGVYATTYCFEDLKNLLTELQLDAAEIVGIAENAISKLPAKPIAQL